MPKKIVSRKRHGVAVKKVGRRDCSATAAGHGSNEAPSKRTNEFFGSESIPPANSAIVAVTVTVIATPHCYTTDKADAMPRRATATLLVCGDEHHTTTYKSIVRRLSRSSSIYAFARDELSAIPRSRIVSLHDNRASIPPV
ncbi:hypothetical protein V9T40_007448 [Parthenolecanium corni]|uniref:Uncharacterized protein n=1 Tax=Parthenolecanium corni TaxID=536013 RepID=A0AAN9TYL8_9HEMI